MERKSPSEIIPTIINSLKKGEQTLSQLSRSSKVNRVTLSQYISAFEESGIIITRKEAKERHIQLRNNSDSYFDLPIKEQDKKTMQTIYSIIKKTCLRIYKKEQDLNLPIGWYQHGPCSVLIYNGNESEHFKLGYTKKIQEKASEYCKLEPIELQKEIYKKYNNKLYRFKEDIKSGQNLDPMELIKLVPQETIEVTTDFVRATMILGWDKTREIFLGDFWKYISLVNFKESLRAYYGNKIESYLKERIQNRKEEAEERISTTILEYTDSKHSQDKLYQRWVKGKR